MIIITKENFFLSLLFSFLAFLIGFSLNNNNHHHNQSPSLYSHDNSSFKWKMVTTWPPNFPIFQTGVEQLAKEIEIMSAGQLKIQVFAGGELVPALETFGAVSQGTVEMGHGASYYWAGKVPAAQFMSAVPFGMTAKGMNAWLYYGGGLELWRELYEPFNLIPFPAGNSGVQMGGWFNKKINSVEDLKGLKMRIPGLGGKVLAKAGGMPKLLAGGEVYTALERGNIDATEWAGPFHDKRLGLYRAAKYYYYPGWHEPGTTLELIINKQAWEKLPVHLQKIVEIATKSINLQILSQFEALNVQALKELKQKYRVKVLPFPTDVINQLRQLTLETLTEEA
ncbi:MAG: TRAP transporter substrate-binding protein, partial [Thiomargarita sp.]|nr:TRAP transporter substrate-binding protein [Thiomargarita sp.]